MLTADELTILGTLAQVKHPTTAQVHRLCLPHLTQRSVARKLKGLAELGLIDMHRLYPEQGARSPRYYHLLKAGAVVLGQDRVGSQHYRVERREFAHYRSAWLELALLAREQGWVLSDSETEARTALCAFLLQRARAQHGTDFPDYTVSSLLPARLAPDRVLTTERESLLCIVAHPHTAHAFWHGRVAKYTRKQTLSSVRAVAICLSDPQRGECERVLEAAGVLERVLVLTPSTLMDLARHLRGP